MAREYAVKRFVMCVAVLAAGCRGGHGRPRVDASHDPSQADGGVAADCTSDQAELGCGISVLGIFNHCPHVSFDATPVQTFVDRGVQVQSMSVDPEGDAMAYEWTAEPDGTFLDNTAILTRYVCASIGRKTIYLKVLDARGCDSVDSLEVSCVDVGDFLRSGVTTITDTP